MRLLTYNIHKGIGGRDRRYRLERVIEVIEHEKPDLLCLQEVNHNVRRSRHNDQARLLAECFCCEKHLYQCNVKLKAGGYGNLLFHPLADPWAPSRSLRLKNKKPRGASWRWSKRQGPLHVVNWHLGLAERAALASESSAGAPLVSRGRAPADASRGGLERLA